MLNPDEQALRKDITSAFLAAGTRFLAALLVCVAEVGAQATTAGEVPPKANSGMPASISFVFLTVFGLAIFIAVQPIVSYLSGWRKLAKLYPQSDIMEGQLFRITQGAVGRLRNKNVMRLRAGYSHLHFSMLRLFSIGHAPFSVPWSDVTGTQGKYFLFHRVARLTMVKAPSIRITVPADVGERVIAASRGQARFVDDAEKPGAAQKPRG